MTSRFLTDTAEMIQESAHWIRQKLPNTFHPKICLILGSGLQSLSKSVAPIAQIPYDSIPGFVQPKVEGHHGRLIIGSWQKKDLLVFCGRNHYYEGYSMNQVTFPVRLAASLGVQTLILTAAVGSANPKLRAGEIALIRDHIHFMGTHPLRGVHDEWFGERFPDLSACYDPALRKLAQRAAKKAKARLLPAVYFAVSGPSYETPAEVRAYRRLGADIIGMSVTPESIVAQQMGIKVLGLCNIANMAAGISKRPLNHQEVLESGKKTAQKMSSVMAEILKLL